VGSRYLLDVVARSSSCVSQFEQYVCALLPLFKVHTPSARRFLLWVADNINTALDYLVRCSNECVGSSFVKLLSGAWSQVVTADASILAETVEVPVRVEAKPLSIGDVPVESAEGSVQAVTEIGAMDGSLSEESVSPSVRVVPVSVAVRLLDSILSYKTLDEVARNWRKVFDTYLTVCFCTF
jgi:hypothetical protein